VTAVISHHDCVHVSQGDSEACLQRSLYVGVSLIALMGFGAPGLAEAACTGANQTIGAAVTGPILGTGGGVEVLSSGTLAGGFDGLSLDGAACSTKSSDVWRCGGFLLSLDVVAGAGGSVDLGVSGVPEPSTWALLLAGLLGLAGFAARRRTRSV